MSKRRIAFIVNPVSGTKDKDKILSYATKHPAFTHDDVLVYKTTYAGDAIVTTRDLVNDGFEIVVAVGGDGTVNEVAQGAMNTSAAVGILPLGSGNGLARDLGIPMNLTRAVDLLAVGTRRVIDAGNINEQRFFCTSGIGYDALVGNRFAESKTRGLLTYVKVSLGEYFGYKPQRYRITTDEGVVECEAFLVTVANANQWGNNVFIAPLADMSDGLFDVVIVSPFPLVAVPSIGFRMVRKSMHKSRYVTVIKTRKVVIEREREDYIHYDGEPGRMGELLEYEIIPATLNVIAGK